MLAFVDYRAQIAQLSPLIVVYRSERRSETQRGLVD